MVPLVTKPAILYDSASSLQGSQLPTPKTPAYQDVTMASLLKPAFSWGWLEVGVSTLLIGEQQGRNNKFWTCAPEAQNTSQLCDLILLFPSSVWTGSLLSLSAYAWGYNLINTPRTGQSTHLGDLAGITSVRLYWEPPTPTRLH